MKKQKAKSKPQTSTLPKSKGCRRPSFGSVRLERNEITVWKMCILRPNGSVGCAQWTQDKRPSQKLLTREMSFHERGSRFSLRRERLTEWMECSLNDKDQATDGARDENQPKKSKCSQLGRYPFVNNQGKVIWIEGKTTIPELLKMGVKNISFEPQGSPMPTDKRIYVHAVTENDQLSQPQPAAEP